MSDRISVGDVEDRKLKRQFEETEDSLTQSLCSNYHKEGNTSGSATKAESGVGVSNLSAPSKGLDVEPSRQRRRKKQRQFICKFCNQNFRCGQALGGHLNAHRGERDLIKKLPPSNLGQLSLAPAPYNCPMKNLPSLGVRGSPLSHSGAHMPPPAGAMSWPSHGHGYGYGIGSTCGPAALEENRCEGNNNQQQGGLARARGAGEEQDLDLSLSL